MITIKNKLKNNTISLRYAVKNKQYRIIESNYSLLPIDNIISSRFDNKVINFTLGTIINVDFVDCYAITLIEVNLEITIKELT